MLLTRLFLITSFLWLVACNRRLYPLEVTDLHCENLFNPIGIESRMPRFRWVVSGSGRGRAQSAYRVLVSSERALLDKNIGDLWDSGKTDSDESVDICYGGNLLESLHKYHWKVMVWDEDGHASDWSQASLFATSMDSIEWSAAWIGFDKSVETWAAKSIPNANGMKRKKAYQPSPCSYFRKELSLLEEPSEAFACVSALGIYELYINGVRVSAECFRPGWTDYRKRIPYNVYDIGKYLDKGENTVAIVLADGWYSGNIADRGQNFYGSQPLVKAQIIVKNKQGRVITVCSDTSWKASRGPVREADMQSGETYDARLEHLDWSSSNFDGSNWQPVIVIDTSVAPLFAHVGSAVRRIEFLEPRSITEREPGVYMVDMGQNFSGWAKLRVSGQRGDTVTMRFAEALNEDGSLHTRNLRTAHATDRYILKGSGLEEWEPHFTYHGFRFVEVQGFPGTLTTKDISGVVAHSDLEISGDFVCSNPLLNKLFSNIVWSQRSNFFEVPTDCPQRDERLGWTGDAQVFMKTAAYIADISSFFTKWLNDIRDGQFDDGRFPSTAPRVYNRVAAGWGDAGVICPWNLYQYYNDTLALRESYHSMVRWMDYLQVNDSNFISTLGSFGDWQNVNSETPIPVIATAYYKHSADVMASTCSVLGMPEEGDCYNELSYNIKMAFQRDFVSNTGVVKGGTQTGYLLAIAFDLLNPIATQQATKHLVEEIYHRDTTLATGIIGTQFLLPILMNNGYPELAYKLVQSSNYPSWGYQIEQGATTIWERWNGLTDSAGFHKDSTNSMNHYAYGSVGEWFFSHVAGIQSEGPGFKKILIRPQPGGGLTFARATYKSVRGTINSEWTQKDETFDLHVTIPANTRAIVSVPYIGKALITESGRDISTCQDVVRIGEFDGAYHVEVGSGVYHFKSQRD